jgi:hypothetical protein
LWVKGRKEVSVRSSSSGSNDQLEDKRLYILYEEPLAYSYRLKYNDQLKSVNKYYYLEKVLNYVFVRLKAPRNHLIDLKIECMKHAVRRYTYYISCDAINLQY